MAAAVPSGKRAPGLVLKAHARAKAYLLQGRDGAEPGSGEEQPELVANAVQPDALRGLLGMSAPADEAARSEAGDEAPTQ